MNLEFANPATKQSDSTVTNDNATVSAEISLGNTSIGDLQTATASPIQSDSATTLPNAVVNAESGFIEFSSGGQAAAEANARLGPAGGGDNLAPSSGRGASLPEAGAAASPEDADRQPHGGTVERPSHGSGLVEGGDLAGPDDAGRQPAGGTVEGESAGRGTNDGAIGAGARSSEIGGQAREAGRNPARDAKPAAPSGTFLRVPPLGNPLLPPTTPLRPPNPNYRLRVN